MTSLSRARTAKNEADMEMHKHLAAAIRALDKAEECAGRFTRLEEKETYISSHRARRFVRDIQRSRGILHAIGSLVPGYDHEDPDLLPEEVKAEISRQRIADQKAKKKAATEAEVAE